MRCLSFFLPLVLAQIRPDHIVSHLKHNLDHTVRPCDDFYHHVCPSRLTESDFLISNAKRWFRDVVYPYLPESYGRVLQSLQEDARYVRNDMSLKERREHFLQRCSSDQDSFHQFVTMVRSRDELDSFIGCENGTEVLMTKLDDELFKNQTFNKTMEAKKYIGSLSDLAAWFEYTNNEKNGIFEKEKKISRLFETIKETMLKLLLESKWVVKHNLGTRISRIMNGLHLYSWLYSPRLESALDFFNTSYTLCRDKWISGLLPVEYELCFVKAYEVVVTSINSTLSYDQEHLLPHIASFNAMYNDNDVFVMPPLYGLLDMQDGMSVISSLGNVLAHEVGHAIFENGYYFKKAESPVDIACVKSQMENACELFSGNWTCRSGERTIREDAADIAAVTTTLILKNYLTSSSLNFTTLPHNTTPDQLYFYGIAINWCTQKKELLLSDPHSSSVVRVNGVLMQSTEFQEAFGCVAEDPMVLEDEKKCYVFGELANRRI